jgi:DNA repair ATPase RecN
LNFGPYCRYCIPLVYWLASNIYNTHSNMSLGETRKLLQQSRKIVDEADDNTNISVLLNTILKLVSSIDVRLKGVEKSVGKFDEIKNYNYLTKQSRSFSWKNIINCQAKITDVENSVQGVGNLFDNLKSDCDKNKSEITKVWKKFDILKSYCEKNKSEIAKVSDQLKAFANQESSNSQCNWQGHMKTLQNSILDLQCRSMKKNLIFTGLYEVRDENTEELLRHFLYKEIVIDFRIDFGNVHRV